MDDVIGYFQNLTNRIMKTDLYISYHSHSLDLL